jgi:hypothetical protein
VTRPVLILLAGVWLAIIGVSAALATELARDPAPQADTPAGVVAQPTLPPPPPSPTPQPLNGPSEAEVPLTETPIRWRRSRAVGMAFAGRLAGGVELPAGGRDYFTWDPILKRSPSRAWRRNGTDDLVRVLLKVLREYREANPGAPRVGIGDLSRPRGGVFDQRFGGLGHASHQNGLDVDVYYPRLDGTERRPLRPDQVDQRLAQDLVDGFAAAGAQYVFVGPRLSLTGPRRIVSKLAHHDDHLHFRLSSSRDR